MTKNPYNGHDREVEGRAWNEGYLAAQADAQAVLDEWEAALAAYPDHTPTTAMANYKAGREVWDSNGDLW